MMVRRRGRGRRRGKALWFKVLTCVRHSSIVLCYSTIPAVPWVWRELEWKIKEVSPIYCTRVRKEEKETKIFYVDRPIDHRTNEQTNSVYTERYVSIIIHNYRHQSYHSQMDKRDRRCAQLFRALFSPELFFRSHRLRTWLGDFALRIKVSR